MDRKSTLGYSKGSPYRNNPYLDINTPQGLIDMSNTDIPLYAQDETGYSKILMPHSGMHQFNGTKVRETRMQYGGMSKQDIYSFLFEGDEEEQEEKVTTDKPTAPAEEEVESFEIPKTNFDDYDLAMSIVLSENAPRRNYRWRQDGKIELDPDQSYNGREIASNARSEYAFNYYTSRGVPAHVAAGIVGNLMQESGLNPSAVGDNGLARGIAQWHPDRFEGLKKYSKGNPYKLETQLDYVLHEAEQRGDMDRMLNTRNSGEAAYTFAKHYERPKVIDKKRINYAKGLFQKGGTFGPVYNTSSGDIGSSFPRVDVPVDLNLKKLQEDKRKREMILNVPQTTVSKDRVRTNQEKAEAAAKRDIYWKDKGYNTNERGEPLEKNFLNRAADAVAPVEKVGNDLLNMSALVEGAGLLKAPAKILTKSLINNLDNTSKYIGTKVKSSISDYFNKRAITKMHNNLDTYINNPITKSRLRGIGVSEDVLNNRANVGLTFDKQIGSSYNNAEKSININFDELREIKKLGENIDPKSVYAHERGHYFQGLASKNHKETQIQEHQRRMYETLRNKMIENPDDYNPIDKFRISQKLYSLSYSSDAIKPTEIDELSKYLTGRNSNGYRENQIKEYFNYPAEPLAHLSEMRNNMIREGYIKNETSPISESTIRKFITRNKNDRKDRVSSFIDYKDPNNIKDLKYLLNKIPVAVPASVGIGSAAMYRGNK